MAQSEYLGIGFALFVAQEILRRQYPGWEFSPVDADVALDAGIPEVGSVRQVATTRRRPDYFLIGRRTTGWGRIKLVVLECKGTHSAVPFAVEQLPERARRCGQSRLVGERRRRS